MLNWIRERLYNWLVKVEVEDEDDRCEIVATVGRRSPEISGPQDMCVSIYRCTNGFVVEGMVFNHKSANHHNDPTRHRVLVLDGTPEELANAIALIYVKGHMGAAA